MSPVASIALVLVFISIGGTFAAAEIALISLRESQVQALSARGRRGKRVAHLAKDPNRFLAAVQIGVTLAGFLSAAFGAATLADDLAPKLEGIGLSQGAAEGVSLVVVTLLIAYLSLVVGELAPKRLGLQRAEAVALSTAPILDRIAIASRPVIWVLSRSANAVVRLFGGDPHAGGAAITEEELRGLVAAHTSLSPDERRLIDEVFGAGETQLREVMIPRTEVAFLDGAMTVPRALRETKAAPHSRYPVIRGSSDDVVGFVHVRDLVGASTRRTVKVAEVAREVKMLPATKKVLPAMSEMRREGFHLAVVVDEYGGTAGIVTLEDLIEEVIGDIRDEYDVEDPAARTLRGGDKEVDGLLNLDEFAEKTGVTLPDGPYETVAGFLMNRLGHVPGLGDAVQHDGVLLKVATLDGRRVARVRIKELSGEPGSDRG
ncbi:MAG TPA: hemolysin family protein [Mycobacteriales bacterium]|nr:hemolysin family protein [Mycobacteriales bacterium]